MSDSRANGAADNVGDSEHRGAGRFCFARAFKGISGLAGLADDDDEGIFVKHWFAIAEFRGDFDENWDLQRLFKDGLANETSVISGAAGDDVDLVPFFDGCFVNVDVIENDVIFFNATGEDAAEGFDLLKDLFDHEMIIAAFFCRLGVPLDLVDHEVLLCTSKVGNVDMVGVNLSDLAAVEINAATGVGEHGWYVGSDDGLSIAETDDRAGCSCG